MAPGPIASTSPASFAAGEVYADGSTLLIKGDVGFRKAGQEGVVTRYIVLTDKEMKYWASEEAASSSQKPRGRVEVADMLKIDLGSDGLKLLLLNGKVCHITPKDDEQDLEPWVEAFKVLELDGDPGESGPDGPAAERPESRGAAESSREPADTSQEVGSDQPGSVFLRGLPMRSRITEASERAETSAEADASQSTEARLGISSTTPAHAQFVDPGGSPARSTRTSTSSPKALVPRLTLGGSTPQSAGQRSEPSDVFNILRAASQAATRIQAAYRGVQGRRKAAALRKTLAGPWHDGRVTTKGRGVQAAGVVSTASPSHRSQNDQSELNFSVGQKLPGHRRPPPAKAEKTLRTHVEGEAATRLATAAKAGDKHIVVQEQAGFAVGSPVHISSRVHSESRTIASLMPGGQIRLDRVLQNYYPANAAVTVQSQGGRAPGKPARTRPEAAQAPSLLGRARTVGRGGKREAAGVKERARTREDPARTKNAVHDGAVQMEDVSGNAEPRHLVLHNDRLEFFRQGDSSPPLTTIHLSDVTSVENVEGGFVLMVRGPDGQVRRVVVHVGDRQQLQEWLSALVKVDSSAPVEATQHAWEPFEAGCIKAGSLQIQEASVGWTYAYCKLFPGEVRLWDSEAQAALRLQHETIPLGGFHEIGIESGTHLALHFHDGSVVRLMPNDLQGWFSTFLDVLYKLQQHSPQTDSTAFGTPTDSTLFGTPGPSSALKDAQDKATSWFGALSVATLAARARGGEVGSEQPSDDALPHPERASFLEVTSSGRRTSKWDKVESKIDTGLRPTSADPSRRRESWGASLRRARSTEKKSNSREGMFYVKKYNPFDLRTATKVIKATDVFETHAAYENVCGKVNSYVAPVVRSDPAQFDKVTGPPTSRNLSPSRSLPSKITARGGSVGSCRSRSHERPVSPKITCTPSREDWVSPRIRQDLHSANKITGSTRILPCRTSSLTKDRPTGKITESARAAIPYPPSYVSCADKYAPMASLSTRVNNR